MKIGNKRFLKIAIPIILLIIIGLVLFDFLGTITLKRQIKEINIDSLVKRYENNERYIDSTSLGKKGDFKIDLCHVSITDDSLIYAFNLYKKVPKGYELCQSWIAPKETYNLAPNFSDFNNDGYKDLTVYTHLSGRGANERRTLFIFDPKTDTLIFIKNSFEYPNLYYNSRLKNINATAFSGSITTEFLRLVGDSLYEFAYVNYREEFYDDKNDVCTLEICERAKDGTWKTIVNKRVKCFYGWVEFSDYKNLKEIGEDLEDYDGKD